MKTGWQRGERARRLMAGCGAVVEWLDRARREVAWRIGLAVHAPSVEWQRAAEARRIYLEQRRLSEEYARGYLCAWRECFDACMEAIEDEIVAFEASWAREADDASELARAESARTALRAGDLENRASRRVAVLRAGRPPRVTTKVN